MGLFSGLLGNASQKDIEKTERELENILTPAENVELAFSLIRDLIVFTDKRLILVDKQGVTGKKTTYKSYPYRSISRFSVETAGHFDLDAELKIWVSSAEEPAETLTFRSDKSVIAIQKALAEAVLR
jgi:I DNA/RNA helicase